MASRSNIILNDGLVTPVAHTFNPNSGDGNVAGVSIISYEDRISGFKIGFPIVEIQTRAATRNQKNYKVSLMVKTPVMEVVSNSTVSGIAPAPTVAYDVVFRGEFVLPERSSIGSRKDSLAYVRNLLAHATVTSAIVDLESPW